jgi:hypothetical protein
MCHSFCPRTTAHQLVQCKILVVQQSWTQIYSPPLLILRQVGISSLLWEVLLGVGVPWHLFQQLSNKMEQKTVQLPCLLVTLLHFSCSYIIENGIPVPNPFCNSFSDICNSKFTVLSKWTHHSGQTLIWHTGPCPSLKYHLRYNIHQKDQCTDPKMWSRASSFRILCPGLPMITASSETWDKQA